MTLASLLAEQELDLRVDDQVVGCLASEGYQPDYGAALGSTTNGANWMYRMIWSDYPLRDKVASCAGPCGYNLL